ncbi:FAD-dependent oxidoreductase [Thalassotalea euphylliae]|uniref:FAD-dependent oxidoreductase n=1 Tax=Thalassotalea euphylliae TaxID=1655234 RepID=UPI00363A2A6A
MHQTDVIIVGGGMVGGATALALADLGLKVTLFERQAPLDFDQEQPFDLRVSAISLGSEQLLASLDAWHPIHEMRACPYKRLGVSEIESSYTEFNAELIDRTHLGHIIENRVVQLALWKKISEHHRVEVVIGEALESLQTSEAGVSLVGEKNSYCAKLVVAADGANSWVRKQVGIGCTGWNYRQAAMLINVSTALPQQDITWQKFTSSGPLAMLPLPGNNASLVWYHHKDEIKRLSQLSNQQLCEAVNREFPDKLGKIETVIDKAFFPLTRQHANQYYKGSVVLLGDSAHSINPLAGQGVNLGFKDVRALQFAIAEAISGGASWHSESVLKNYERQRRTDNLMMMSGMDAIYSAFSNDNPVVKGLRNAALIAANKLPFGKKKVLEYACGLA